MKIDNGSMEGFTGATPELPVGRLAERLYRGLGFDDRATRRAGHL